MLAGSGIKRYAWRHRRPCGEARVTPEAIRRKVAGVPTHYLW